MVVRINEKKLGLANTANALVITLPVVVVVGRGHGRHCVDGGGGRVIVVVRGRGCCRGGGGCGRGRRHLC